MSVTVLIYINKIYISNCFSVVIYSETLLYIVKLGGAFSVRLVTYSEVETWWSFSFGEFDRESNGRGRSRWRTWEKGSSL